MHCAVRCDPLLRPMHAAVQLHVAFQQRQRAPAAATEEAAPSPVQAASSSPVRCQRCMHATVASEQRYSASGAFHALHRDSLAALPPFATLSSNLSQLAFSVVGDSNDEEKRAAPAAAAQQRMRGASNGGESEFVDAQGWLRWQAFTPQRIAEWNATRSADEEQLSPPASASSAAVVESESSAFLSAACDSVHAFVARISDEEFAARYRRVLDMSQHASLAAELFALFRAGQRGEDDQPAAGSLSAPAVFLILSTHIERLIGDIFCARRSSPNVVCPRMLRALFFTPELTTFLPPEVMFLLQSLCGSPRSFNIRNIGWHGYLGLTCQKTDAALRKFTSLLWMLYLGILRECERIWAPSVLAAAEVPAPIVSGDGAASSPSALPAAPYRRPLKARFVGDASLHAHLLSPLFAPASPSLHAAAHAFDRWPLPLNLVFDSSDATLASLAESFSALISASYLVPHHRVHDLQHAFSLLRSNPLFAVTLLLPSLEQMLRQAYVFANATTGTTLENQVPNPRIEIGLVLAQSERLFTTVDLVIAADIEPLADYSNRGADEDPALDLVSPPPAAQQKCDRNSSYAFPLVAAPCDFDPASPYLNQLYCSSSTHPLLPATPSQGALQALGDLLLSRLGPRLRDRVAHGEISWRDESTLPQWLALWSFNVMLGLAMQFPICAPSDNGASLELPAAFRSETADRARHVFGRYQAITYPRSLLFVRMVEVAQCMQLLDSTRGELADESVASPPLEAGSALPLRAPTRAWYRYSLSHDRAVVTTQGLNVLASAGVEDMSIAANALAVHCGVLLTQLRASQPSLPLWPLLAPWMFDPAADPTTAACAPIDWWMLAADPFWSRAHQVFHHPAAAASACSQSCELHCFDRCMTHAPILGIQRAFDLLQQLPLACHSAYRCLHAVATAADAPSSKRKLLEQVDASMLSITLCCVTTMASQMILLEQMMRKAHTPTHDPSAGASASSSPAAASLDGPALLKQDRSIARLLKKTLTALDRLRGHYPKSRWLVAQEDWRNTLAAIQVWHNCTLSEVLC